MSATEAVPTDPEQTVEVLPDVSDTTSRHENIRLQRKIALDQQLQ